MNTNYQLLVAAARLLVPLLDELVFVGGCATGLMITDEAAASVRPTLDVDVDELRMSPEDLRACVAAEISSLLHEPRLMDALPGYLLPDSISQARISVLLPRLRDLSELTDEHLAPGA